VNTTFSQPLNERSLKGSRWAASGARRTHSRSRPGTGRPPSWRCICPAMRLTQLGSDGAGRYQIMGLVQLCLLKKGTARAGSTMRLLKRRSPAGQFATTLAFPPFNRGTPPCPGGRCKLWDPFHHPTEQAFACRPWRPRMKEYLQCAQRAACRAAPMHAALRAVSGRPGGLTLYSPPSEIDQWQNRPRPAFYFSDQTIRERVVRIVERACSRRLRSGHIPCSVYSA
jgi:hypothetical protein